MDTPHTTVPTPATDDNMHQTLSDSTAGSIGDILGIDRGTATADVQPDTMIR